MRDTCTPPAVREIQDVYGRRYRLGETPRQLTGRSRAWMVWAPWAAMLAVSAMQFGYGALVPALVRTNRWSYADAFWVFGAWVVFQAAAVYPVARLRARGLLSPRTTMVVGAVGCAVGLVCLGWAPSPVAALAGFSVLGGVGTGAVYATCVGVVGEWYPERMAGTVGFVSGGFSYGAVPFVVSVSLFPGQIQAVLGGWAAVLLVVVAGSGWLLRSPPKYWWPAHLDPRAWATDRSLNRSLPQNVPAARPYSPGEAVRSGAMVAMYAVVVLASAVSLFDIATLPELASRSGGASVLIAATAAVLAGVNGVGRTATSWVSDRFGRTRILCLALIVTALAQFGLSAAGSAGRVGAIVLFAGLAGAGNGACFPLMVSLVRDFFGELAIPENYGVVYSAKAVGGLLGIGLAVLAASGTGYPAAFATIGAAGIFAAVLTARLRQPGRPTLSVTGNYPAGRPRVAAAGHGGPVPARAVQAPAESVGPPWDL